MSADNVDTSARPASSQHRQFVGGRGACRYYTTSALVRGIYTQPGAGETRYIFAHSGLRTSAAAPPPPSRGGNVAATNPPRSSPRGGGNSAAAPARRVATASSKVRNVVSRPTPGGGGNFVSPANQARLYDIAMLKILTKYADGGASLDINERRDVLGLTAAHTNAGKEAAATAAAAEGNTQKNIQ